MLCRFVKMVSAVCFALSTNYHSTHKMGLKVRVECPDQPEFVALAEDISFPSFLESASASLGSKAVVTSPMEGGTYWSVRKASAANVDTMSLMTDTILCRTYKFQLWGYFGHQV